MGFSRIKGLEHIKSRLKGPVFNKGEANYIFHKDLVVNGDLYCSNLIGGAIQPNIVIRGHSCLSTEGWRTQNNTKFALANFSDSNPPTSYEQVLKVTRGFATGSFFNWFEWNTPQDLSFLDYLGFFYRGLTGSQAYFGNCIQIVLLSSSSTLNTTDITEADISDRYNLTTSNWTEDTTPSWKYTEIELSNSSRHLRKNIKGIGFYCDLANCNFTNTDNSDGIAFSKMDIYKLGTNFGPVRGRMVAMPVGISQDLSAGDLVDINEDGALRKCSNSSVSYTFQGQVVRTQNYGITGYNYGYSHGPEMYVYVVVDGIINIPFKASATVAKGDGVVINDTQKVTKSSGASEVHKQIGVSLKAVPTQGGTYPIYIGSRGYVGTF